MKSIVCVNVQIPTVENELDYGSEGSLRDYDIVVFDPKLPWYDRVTFSAGGSCISIEGAARFRKSSSHWSREIADALSAGKTVFVVLNAYEEDDAAVGSTTAAKTTNYQTSSVNNYGVIPCKLPVRNASGRSVVVKDPAYKGLYESIKEISEYRVIFESFKPMHTAFSAKDGTAVGGVVKFEDRSGSLVLLPYFDFESEGFTEISDDEEIWSDKALRASNAFVGQLVAVDRMLRGSVQQTPPPDWLSDVSKPKIIDEIEARIAETELRIEALREQKSKEVARQVDILEYSKLLYESGKPLERAIEKALRLLGYSVDGLRIGDLEIDHVVLGPSGRRMIGESEGKDSSAIDISKFRQLESNIGEDFERDEIDQPAKGLLFGNGFRLAPPSTRAEQFTQKSLTNAARLGSSLIRTSDLYRVSVHLLNNPEDEEFRKSCRDAIEETAGGIVTFPDT